MNQWQIGNVKVTRVVEMEIAGGSRFILPQATRDEVKKIPWLAPHFADEEGRLIMSVHALVIETPTRKMIVDTCIGNDKQRSIPNWSNLQLPFLEDLKAAGYDRHDIDTVMCTHLHVDHVGWNTMLVDGEWIPTFPNARYLMAKPEYEYWDDEDAGEDDIMVDSVRPVFEAGLVDLVETDHVVCDEVFFEPTFGHTPGHVSVHIRAEGEEALITGDCIHHPCQIERLDWASSADYDQSESTKTRHSLMDKYADQDILIIGTHFATPTAGHLKSNDSGYWLDVGGTT
ncbi:MAG: MBL fold metallo-hydrolase [Pseudomonadales bacterium]|nr:MBL fold metallo-hydrolase [Pseudomonadales bacterium]MBO7007832.1 MBL fold metallo-hydrolase [Pseudomonadales bacterium]